MYEVCQDAVADGVRYIEVRFSPILHTQGGMSLSQVMEGTFAPHSHSLTRTLTLTLQLSHSHSHSHSHTLHSHTHTHTLTLTINDFSYL